MRIAIVPAIATLLGVGLGMLIVSIRLNDWPWSGRPGDSPNSVAMWTDLEAKGPNVGAPRVVVPEKKYDFGMMDADDEGAHDFTFENQGTAPLDLTVGDTSCKCTVGELQSNRIEPGESTKVTVRWKAEGRIGPYSQSAVIHSNDPRYPRVELVVSGTVAAALQCRPPELAFSNVIPASASAEEEVVALGYTDEPLRIPDRGWAWSDSDTADHFEVAVQPLSEEELKEYPDVRSGARIRVKVLPGMEQGRFEQKLLMATGMESSPELVIPVQGTIGGNFHLAAKGWDSLRGILALGQIDAAEGLSPRPMFILASGVPVDNVQLRVKSVTPDWLEVTLGGTEAIGNSSTESRTPLTIKIPPGSRTAYYLGDETSEVAKIEIATGHPKTPTFTILLRFVLQK